VSQPTLIARPTLARGKPVIRVAPLWPARKPMAVVPTLAPPQYYPTQMNVVAEPPPVPTKRVFTMKPVLTPVPTNVATATAEQIAKLRRPIRATPPHCRLIIFLLAVFQLLTIINLIPMLQFAVAELVLLPARIIISGIIPPV